MMACHSNSTSMCHATSTNFMPQDDESCHANIYVSFHVSIVSMSDKISLNTNGRGSMEL
jgi:hypothetical protein